MKWFAAAALCLALTLLCAPCAFGADGETALVELRGALPYETQTLLRNVDLSGNGWQEGVAALLAAGGEEGRALLRRGLGSGTKLLLIVLLCDGAQILYFREKDSKLLQCVSMTGALAVVMLSAGSISDMIGLGAETIHTLNDFSKTLLPLLAAACATSGQVTAAAVREVGTSLFADVLITCIDRLLIPLVYLYIGAITAGAVLREHHLQKIAGAIKKCMVWTLTVLLTVFTAYLTISGAISGAADATALKATRLAISTAVPVVGGIMSDAAGALLVGASLLKNAIGVFGMLAVFALCITPFLQIGVQYLVYKIAAFLAEIVDQSGLSQLIGEIGGAFGMVLGMTGACALLLMISVVTSVAAVMPG